MGEDFVKVDDHSLTEDGVIEEYYVTHKGKSVIRLAARQSFSELYRMNGAVWVTSRDLIMNDCLVVGPNAYSVVTDDIEAVDIDTEVDFVISNSLMKYFSKK
mgnify:CR=1 FL=1